MVLGSRQLNQDIHGAYWLEFSASSLYPVASCTLQDLEVTDLLWHKVYILWADFSFLPLFSCRDSKDLVTRMERKNKRVSAQPKLESYHRHFFRRLQRQRLLEIKNNGRICCHCKFILSLSLFVFSNFSVHLCAMAKVKKKTTPITQRTDKKFKHSSKETAKLIRRYHVLNKELAKCRSNNDREKEQQILAEMEAMGGLEWYQRASQLGQSKARGGDSSKWLLKKLEKHGYRKEKLRLLEIGAVAPDNYDKVKSWITVLPIDLNPQDPRIKKQDFLEMKPTDKFDVLSLSLVVNFVGDPKDRGERNCYL